MKRAKQFLSFSCLAISAIASAQDYPIWLTYTPTMAGSLQQVARYKVSGYGAAMRPLADIPASLTNDPADVFLLPSNILLISNRHGNTGTDGSVTRLQFDATFDSYTELSRVTGNSLANCHQLAVDPVTGELFVQQAYNGVMPRFLPSGSTFAANGVWSSGDGTSRGVCFSPSGKYLFIVTLNAVTQYKRNGSSWAFLRQVASGFNATHWAEFRGHDLYVAELYGNVVRRWTIGEDDSIASKPTISADYPLDVAFSPDAQEMFVSNHIQGGLTRYRYNTGADTWSLVETRPHPQLAGVTTTYDPLSTIVGGSISLPSYSGNKNAVTATVQVRTGSGSAVESHVIRISADGRFFVPIKARGTFTLWIKPSHWLATTIPNVLVGESDRYDLAANAGPNGDIVDDNAVDSSDYFALSDAYDTVSGDASYDLRADLNGDGSVDASDYFILSDAYDLTGTP